MSYFLFNGIINPNKDDLILKGDEARHITLSRRIHAGDELQIQDNTFKRYLCKVKHTQKEQITFSIIQSIVTPSDPILKINLFQALLKEKAMDNIVQKVTELGIFSIKIMETQFSQRVHKNKSIEKVLARWQKIALEACKQSDRLIPPAIHFTADISNYISMECSKYSKPTNRYPKPSTTGITIFSNSN